MDLQEILKKQKTKGFKKPMTASHTLSINDYLSDPNASRPYIDESLTKKSLSVVPAITTTEEKAIAEQPVQANITPIVKSTHAAAKTETPDLVIDSPKSVFISDTKATQEFRSATQQSSSATQELYYDNTKATQEFRSATQTATQQFKKNHSKVGRPKIESFDYTKLVGNELHIVNEIYAECLKSKSFETSYIEKSEFSQRIKVKSGAIRTSCTRLRNKGVLEDFIATKGRGSAWKFVLAETIFHQISMKNTLKLTSISDTNSDTTILSSSRSNINKTTTTQLPMDWKKIEYAQLQNALNFFNERFGLQQIKSIFLEAGELISAHDMQTSIDNFTIGLNNYIQKPSPGIYDRKVKIATLIECLKNAEIFTDPNVEALKEAETKRILTEKRKAMAAQYFEPKFEHYFSSLSDDQAVALIPATWKHANTAWEHAIQKNNKLLQLSYAKDFAREHFEKNIWPDVLRDLLKV